MTQDYSANMLEPYDSFVDLASSAIPAGHFRPPSRHKKSIGYAAKKRAKAKMSKASKRRNRK